MGVLAKISNNFVSNKIVCNLSVSCLHFAFRFARDGTKEKIKAAEKGRLFFSAEEILTTSLLFHKIFEKKLDFLKSL